jgi:hypothetical protein
MYRDIKTNLSQILFVIVLIFLASGWLGLINLGKGILFDLWVILQVLPFFKWDLLVAVLKILWGFL